MGPGYPRFAPPPGNISLVDTNPMHTDNLQHELEKSVQQLLDYQITLKGQSKRIKELEGEEQMLHDHNQSLEEKVEALDVKLRRASTAKESLELKVTQLSEQLDGMLSCSYYGCSTHWHLYMIPLSQ